jgi:RES domain-containing protein
MQLWRISDYASLSGEGGLYFEGRWHSVGLPILYLAASPPGALIEVLVHLELGEGPLPENYQLLEIAAPDSLASENLTPDSQGPAKMPVQEIAQTRALGDAWLRSRGTPLARVPSAILPSTWNYLLNPMHPDAGQIAIQSATKVGYDVRLFRKLR